MRTVVRQAPTHRGSGVLALIATFRADGRPPTVRHLVGDGLHGLVRTIGWSLGLAVAILLLTTATTAKAAEPDTGGSLLGGLAGGLGDIVEPVDDLIEPVADPIVEPVIEPIVPVLEPVTSLPTQVVEPVGDLVDPILDPIVEPVSGIVTPVMDPVDDLVETLVDPVTQPVTGLVAPAGQLLQPLAGVTQSTTPCPSRPRAGHADRRPGRRARRRPAVGTSDRRR